MSPQYGELQPTNGWDRFGSSGTQTNFNQFLRLGYVTARRRSKEVNKTLQDVWPSPGLVHYIYIFGGSCHLTEFCQLQNSLCVQVLHSPTLEVLLHGTQAVVVSQTLWHGTRNGITEFSQRAPPVFGRATIRLGIGPHSSSSTVSIALRKINPYCVWVVSTARIILLFLLSLVHNVTLSQNWLDALLVMWHKSTIACHLKT